MARMTADIHQLRQQVISIQHDLRVSQDIQHLKA